MRTGTLKQSDFLDQKTYRLADGSTVPSQTFRIRSLKVGSKVIENVNGSVASAKGTLLLGQSFLSRFKSWSIDVPAAPSTPAKSSTASEFRSSAGERSQSTLDEGKARRMCGGGVIEGQGEVQQKPARAVAPETRLARLMERELHLAIDPQRPSPLHHRPLEQNLGSGSPNHDENVKSDG
jgi:hypothetical protein